MSARVRNAALHARVTQIIRDEWGDGGTAEDAAEAVLNLLLDPSGRKVSGGNVEAAARGAVVEPVADEHGRETHPAWTLIGASRVSQGPTGAVLFDSDIKHTHYVVVKLMTASRTRSHMRDHIMGGRTVHEVAMSEAQWASFVSSMNAGDGVPCTTRFRQGEGPVAGMPHESRLRASLDETRGAAELAFGAIRAAFVTYQAKKNAGNLRALEAAIRNAVGNVAFAGESLTEHTENVVQKAKRDLEAMVDARARQLGIDPAEVDGTLQLGAGEER